MARTSQGDAPDAALTRRRLHGVPEKCFNPMIRHEFGIGIFQDGKTKFGRGGKACAIGAESAWDCRRQRR
ncbi:hypothetical protein D9X30_1015 [Cupriavidus sp. U2]|nr:hypothetical protein D9X30_1015 [Cupriavidus sp. U2]